MKYLTIFCLLINFIFAQSPGKSSFIEAEIYFKQNKFKEAILLYKKSINFEPTNPKYHFKLAFCYLKTDSVDLAISNVKNAKNIDSTFADSHFLEGLIYEKQKNYDLAINSFYEALDYEIESNKRIQIEFHMAFCHLKLNKIDYALESMETLEKDNLEDYRIQFILGQIYKLKKNCCESILKLKKSIELIENKEIINKESFNFALGEAYFYNNEISNAEAIWIKCKNKSKIKSIKSIPNFKDSLNYWDFEDEKLEVIKNKAQNYFEKGEYKKAIVEIDKINILEPNNSKYHYKKAVCLFNINYKDTLETSKSLLQSLSIDYEHDRAYALLARLYEINNQYISAIQYYKLAEQNENDMNVKIRYNSILIHLYLKVNETENAQNVIAELKNYAPGDPSILFIEGQLYGLQKDWENSLKCYQDALDKCCIGPPSLSTKYYFAIGEVLYNLGKKEKAENVWKNCYIMEKSEIQRVKSKDYKFQLYKNEFDLTEKIEDWD